MTRAFPGHVPEPGVGPSHPLGAGRWTLGGAAPSPRHLPSPWQHEVMGQELCQQHGGAHAPRSLPVVPSCPTSGERRDGPGRARGTDRAGQGRRHRGEQPRGMSQEPCVPVLPGCMHPTGSTHPCVLGKSGSGLEPGQEPTQKKVETGPEQEEGPPTRRDPGDSTPRGPNIQAACRPRHSESESPWPGSHKALVIPVTKPPGTRPPRD